MAAFPACALFPRCLPNVRTLLPSMRRCGWAWRVRAMSSAYSSSAAPNNPGGPFDKAAVRARDAKARHLRGVRAKRDDAGREEGGDPDVVERLAADELTDRLLDTNKTDFRSIAVVGGGRAAELVCENLARRVAPVKAVERVHVVDADPDTRRLCLATFAASNIEATDAHGDAEEPGFSNAFDAIIFPLNLHWCNRPDAALTNARRALEKDGIMLAAILGGSTLTSLRRACVLAELERRGGVAPRVAPSIRMRDAGNLLGAANFDAPAADAETIRLRYPSPFALVEHLRYMGQTNVMSRGNALTRDTALAAAAVAAAEAPEDADGGMDAEYELLFLTGWASDGNGTGGGCGGAKSARRGSATVSLADLANQLE